MPTPEVLDGYRTPRPERTREVEEKIAKRGPGPQPVIPVGKRVFQFIAAKYRIQVTAPETVTFSDGRKIRGGKPIFVEAKNNMTTLDIVKDALAIEAIEKNARYGMDFWDFAVVLASAQAKQAESVKSALMDPAVLKNLTLADREQLVEQLLAAKDEDFDVKPVTKSGGPKQ